MRHICTRCGQPDRTFVVGGVTLHQEAIIEAWQMSDSPRQAAERLGIGMHSYLGRVITYLRLRGHKLKRFKCGPKPGPVHLRCA